MKMRIDGRIKICEPMSWGNAAGSEASNPINTCAKSALFVVLVTVVTPGLHVAVVPDSMMVSTGRVGEGFGAIGA